MSNGLDPRLRADNAIIYNPYQNWNIDTLELLYHSHFVCVSLKPLQNWDRIIPYFWFKSARRCIWATTWDFQQCGMWDQQRLRPACAYAQSGQSLCWSLEYSMNFNLLTEQHLEFLRLNRRLHRLVWVYNCQNATLLEITCHSSFCMRIIKNHSELGYNNPIFLVQMCTQMRF